MILSFTSLATKRLVTPFLRREPTSINVFHNPRPYRLVPLLGGETSLILATEVQIYLQDYWSVSRDNEPILFHYLATLHKPHSSNRTLLTSTSFPLCGHMVTI